MLFYNFLFLFFLNFDLTDSLVLDLFFDEADELAQVFHSFISQGNGFLQKPCPSSSSFAPTISIYGTLSRRASRILYPIFSERPSTERADACLFHLGLYLLRIIVELLGDRDHTNLLRAEPCREHSCILLNEPCRVLS